jgi:hypothetical protein
LLTFDNGIIATPSSPPLLGIARADVTQQHLGEPFAVFSIKDSNVSDKVAPSFGIGDSHDTQVVGLIGVEWNNRIQRERLFRIYPR